MSSLDIKEVNRETLQTDWNGELEPVPHLPLDLICLNIICIEGVSFSRAGKQ